MITSPKTNKQSLKSKDTTGNLLTNAPEITVSDLSKSLKRMVETGFAHVRVRGEIGSCKQHSSGHLYMSMKEDNAVLDAVCWRGVVSKLGIKPETGMDVICTGRITTYAGQSKYQLVVEGMELAGEGALLKMLEERRKKLAKEGLFDQDRKKEIPFLPEVIGVITSPTGAVIRDIIHRLEDRFPRRVLLWPVHVQGASAAAEITEAIDGFNKMKIATEVNDVPRPDVLIVARGGGSLEDLMAFNEENVVRAVAASSIPIISAVGHETDTTLIDYASDLRAPTPTGAAEKAVPVRTDLLMAVEDVGLRLQKGLHRMARDRKDRLQLVARALGDPSRAIMPLAQRLDEKSDRLQMSWKTFWRQHRAGLIELAGRLRHPRDVVLFAQQKLESLSQTLSIRSVEQKSSADKRFERAASLLEALSPKAVMRRGYGLVFDENGKLVTSAASLKKDQSIRIELHDGSRGARVED